MMSNSSTLARVAARAFRPSHFGAPARTMCTGGSRRDGGSAPPQPLPASDEEDDFLEDDNVSDLNPGEVARLRAMLKLIREHVEARDAGREPPVPEENPLIDPRSFALRGLPSVDGDVLASFREELPADAAGEARPVHTGALWDGDGTTAPNTGAYGPKAVTPAGTVERATPAWGAVDARTMGGAPPRRVAMLATGQGQGQGQQRQQQSQAQQRAAALRAVAEARPRAEEDLSGVKVDFRAVGLLSSYLGDTGKIVPRRRTGLTPQAQKKIARAVKTARHMALIHPEPKPELSYEEMVELSRQAKAQSGRSRR